MHGVSTYPQHRLRGWAAHEMAVAALVHSFRQIPPGTEVRLRKRTSNLFRPRTDATAPGVDVSGLDGVISIDVDPETAEATADVQGMCTYEDLVAATLAEGYIPFVVPQLRTITLGGAVTGLGIESTSFRNGLPHESVLEMDVLTGAGEVVTATPEGEHADLFRAFPNSYGSLGYATRLRIRLEAAPPRVALRHVRFTDPERLTAAMEHISAEREWEGVQVDAMDGVAFAPGEYYLTLAEWTSRPGRPSDYAGRAIYYRSLQQRASDLLTIHDYLWRWDTDWFWCSRAMGVQHPLVRRLWPRRWKRSDVYHRLVGLDRRFGLVRRVDAFRGRPQREMVVQDIEVPAHALGSFLEWFEETVGMRPVWLCPLVSVGTGDGEHWACYPLRPGELYVNVGFWGTVPVGPDADEAPLNRAIEAKVLELDGHKSLYSEAFYDRATFDSLYGGTALAEVKRRHDPDSRLTSLYDKVVRRR